MLKVSQFQSIIILVGSALCLSSSAQDVVRVETNVVTLNVAVTDKKGNYVHGLTQEQFSITDNGIKQEIDSFSSEAAPASIGIVYYMVPASTDQIANILDGLKQFTQKLGSRDEYFVNIFGSNGSLTTEFVPTEEQIRNFVENGDRKAQMSLFDAIFKASNRIAEMRNPKKLLIVLTQGADRNSMHNLKELRLHLRSINLPVYSLTFGTENRRTFSYADVNRNGPRQTFSVVESSELDRSVLAELSKTTGGQSFETNLRNRYYLTALCTKVLTEINNQYVIAFSPEAADGKWHKLSVSINSSSKYKVSSRRGYQSRKKLSL